MYNRYINDSDFVPTQNEAYPADIQPDKEESPGLLGSLLSNLKIPHLELDDILLLVIIYLLLRESDDSDMIIILAFLFFTGFFDRD